MNVINRIPLPLTAVREYIKDLDENKPIVTYCKKFCKQSKEEVEKLIAGLRNLNNPKVHEELIIKITDISAQDAEDLNKIFLEVSLTEEEANAILALVKK